jgi:hypothetical protein
VVVSTEIEQQSAFRTSIHVFVNCRKFFEKMPVPLFGRASSVKQIMADLIRRHSLNMQPQLVALKLAKRI